MYFSQRQLVAGGVLPRGGDHHGLGHAADLVADLGPVVLDDHLGLLGQLVRVQRHEPGDRRPGLARVVLRVVFLSGVFLLSCILAFTIGSTLCFL